MYKLHPLEVVGCGREKQIQVAEKFNKLAQRNKGEPLVDDPSD